MRPAFHIDVRVRPGTDATDLAVAVVAVIVVAVLGIALAVSRLSVVVDDHLVVRMTPFWYRRTIDPATVLDADVVELRGSEWGGWGVRTGMGRGTAVLMDNGPGVRLRFERGRALTFRCDDPGAVIAALRAHGGGSGSGSGSGIGSTGGGGPAAADSRRPER